MPTQTDFKSLGFQELIRKSKELDIQTLALLLKLTDPESLYLEILTDWKALRYRHYRLRTAANIWLQDNNKTETEGSEYWTLLDGFSPQKDRLRKLLTLHNDKLERRAKRRRGSK